MRKRWAQEALTTLTVGYRFNGCSGTQTFANLHVSTAPTSGAPGRAGATTANSLFLPAARPDMLPAWSPSGARLAFSSARDGNLEIYVAQAVGSGVTRVTRTDLGAAWSRANGSQATRITHHPAVEGA